MIRYLYGSLVLCLWAMIWGCGPGGETSGGVGGTGGSATTSTQGGGNTGGSTTSGGGGGGGAGGSTSPCAPAAVPMLTRMSGAGLSYGTYATIGAGVYVARIVRPVPSAGAWRAVRILASDHNLGGATCSLHATYTFDFAAYQPGDDPTGGATWTSVDVDVDVPPSAAGKLSTFDIPVPAALQDEQQLLLAIPTGGGLCVSITDDPDSASDPWGWKGIDLASVAPAPFALHGHLVSDVPLADGCGAFVGQSTVDCPHNKVTALGPASSEDGDIEARVTVSGPEHVVGLSVETATGGDYVLPQGGVEVVWTFVPAGQAPSATLADMSGVSVDIGDLDATVEGAQAIVPVEIDVPTGQNLMVGRVHHVYGGQSTATVECQGAGAKLAYWGSVDPAGVIGWKNFVDYSIVAAPMIGAVTAQ